MAQAAAIDTGVLYSAFVTRDEHHETGLAVVKDVDQGALPRQIVPDFVLAETMNGLSQVLEPADAREALTMVEASSGFDVVRTSSAVWSRGRALFEQQPQLSFVDGLLVAAAVDRDLSYLYSFDTGFDGIEGLTRLNTNVDPYAP